MASTTIVNKNDANNRRKATTNRRLQHWWQRGGIISVGCINTLYTTINVKIWQQQQDNTIIPPLPHNITVSIPALPCSIWLLLCFTPLSKMAASSLLSLHHPLPHLGWLLSYLLLGGICICGDSGPNHNTDGSSTLNHHHMLIIIYFASSTFLWQPCCPPPQLVWGQQWSPTAKSKIRVFGCVISNLATAATHRPPPTSIAAVAIDCHHHPFHSHTSPPLPPLAMQLPTTGMVWWCGRHYQHWRQWWSSQCHYRRGKRGASLAHCSKPNVPTRKTSLWAGCWQGGNSLPT